MLEKLNYFVYNAEYQFLGKQLIDKNGARAEKNVLQKVSDISGISCEFPFRVPTLNPEFCSLYSVAMSHHRGIRLLDCISLLNAIPQSLGCSASLIAFKDQLLENSIKSVRFFQDRRVQSHLKKDLDSNVIVYDYLGKFEEAVEYVAQVNNMTEFLSSMAEDVEKVCKILSRRATMLFRDASLKNRLLIIPQKIIDQGYAISDSLGGYAPNGMRPSERPCTDTELILRLADQAENFSKLVYQIYDIDFESTCALTVPQDDYFHILLSEAAGLSYEKAMQYLKEYELDNESLCNHILLFRFFREWARRLFYYHERPFIFERRYRYETIDHYFNTAINALERLQNGSSGYLSGLYSFMSQFKTSERKD
jgi:hypothetical protein